MRSNMAGANLTAVSNPTNNIRHSSSRSTSRNDLILNPERLKNILPRVPIQSIEDIVIKHSDEPPVEIMKRLRAASDGVPYNRPDIAKVKVSIKRSRDSVRSLSHRWSRAAYGLLTSLPFLVIQH